ncbi:hypothetical protein AOA73_06100 [Pseudomonas aeruginosa]|nr:hypothetical protein AOA75_09660 [Pseudomonas aeruginosa]KPE39220.1 hypothetical protein AOA73_06100 [Pseudomonas aeruginosa]RIZ00696.1 hypothetical protein AXW97_02765 [Pseudomonas aeruginosa]
MLGRAFVFLRPQQAASLLFRFFSYIPKAFVLLLILNAVSGILQRANSSGDKASGGNSGKQGSSLC